MSEIRSVARAIVAGAAVLCAMAGPAAAQVLELNRTEAWSAFVARAPDTGLPVCGLRTDLPDSRALFFRQAQGGTVASGVAVRPTWRVPAGTGVDVQVQIDRHPASEAVASPSPGGQGLVWAIPPAPWKAWLQQAPGATSLRVRFPQGDEPEWTPRVDGLGAVLPVFADCVRRINAGESVGLPAPTQPFGMPGPSSNSAPPARPPVLPPSSAAQRALKTGFGTH